jgi:endonuclease/exonuclease/phosphatase family metal-dependent hydrolase
MCPSKSLGDALCCRDTNAQSLGYLALIACGDFNVEPNSETFRVLGRLGLVDLVTSRGFQGTRTSQYSKPGRFADHKLVNDRVTVLDFPVVSDPEVSYH